MESMGRKKRRLNRDFVNIVSGSVGLRIRVNHMDRNWRRLFTWNVGIRRVIVGVWTLELGPRGTLAHHDVMRLASPFRLQSQQSPVGGRLASPHFPQRFTCFDLGVDLARRSR